MGDRKDRKPPRDRPSPPRREAAKPQSDLDREVAEFVAETLREPYPGQAELPMTTEQH